MWLGPPCSQIRMTDVSTAVPWAFLAEARAFRRSLSPKPPKANDPTSKKPRRLTGPGQVLGNIFMRETFEFTNRARTLGRSETKQIVSRNRLQRVNVCPKRETCRQPSSSPLAPKDVAALHCTHSVIRALMRQTNRAVKNIDVLPYRPRLSSSQTLEGVASDGLTGKRTVL